MVLGLRIWIALSVTYGVLPYFPSIVVVSFLLHSAVGRFCCTFHLELVGPPIVTAASCCCGGVILCRSGQSLAAMLHAQLDCWLSDSLGVSAYMHIKA